MSTPITGDPFSFPVMSLLDQCQRCFALDPWADRAATSPAAVVAKNGDGVTLRYVCPARHTWTCSWNVVGIALFRGLIDRPARWDGDTSPLDLRDAS